MKVRIQVVQVCAHEGTASPSAFGLIQTWEIWQSSEFDGPHSSWTRGGSIGSEACRVNASRRAVQHFGATSGMNLSLLASEYEGRVRQRRAEEPDVVGEAPQAQLMHSQLHVALGLPS